MRKTEIGSATWDHAAALAKKQRAATPVPKGVPGWRGWGGVPGRELCVWPHSRAGHCVGSKWGRR